MLSGGFKAEAFVPSTKSIARHPPALTPRISIEQQCHSGVVSKTDKGLHA
jgi:hypothetical protein